LTDPPVFSVTVFGNQKSNSPFGYVKNFKYIIWWCNIVKGNDHSI